MVACRRAGARVRQRAIRAGARGAAAAMSSGGAALFSARAKAKAKGTQSFPAARDGADRLPTDREGLDKAPQKKRRRNPNRASARSVSGPTDTTRPNPVGRHAY